MENNNGRKPLAPDTFFGAPIRKYQEKKISSNKQSQREDVNPYLLSAKQKQIFTRHQDNPQRYVSWIHPIPESGHTPYDASESHSAAEVLQKYNEFKRLIEQYPLYDKKSPQFDKLDYRAYNLFVKNLLDNLSPELRNDTKEMIAIIKMFPVAFLSINPKILSADFVAEALQYAPRIYPTLQRNPKHWVNVSEITNHPDVISAYVDSVVHHDITVSYDRLSPDEQKTCDVDEIAILSLAPTLPIKLLNPMSLYEKVCKNMFYGVGVYSNCSNSKNSRRQNNKITIGPIIAAKIFLEDNFPEMQDDFNALCLQMYEKHKGDIRPISKMHEEHLIEYAQHNKLPSPTYHFEKSSKIKDLAVVNPYDLSEKEKQLIISVQEENRNHVPVLRLSALYQQSAENNPIIPTARDFFAAHKELMAKNPKLSARAGLIQLLPRISSEMRSNERDMLRLIEKCPEAFFKADSSLYTPRFFAKIVSSEPKLYETIRRAEEGSAFYTQALPYIKQELRQNANKNYPNLNDKEAYEAELQNASYLSKPVLDLLTDKPTIYNAKINTQGLLQDESVIEAYLEGVINKTFIFDSRSIFDEQRLLYNTYIASIAALDISPFCPLNKVHPEFYQIISARAISGHDAYTLTSSDGEGKMDREGVIGPAVVLREMIRHARPESTQEWDAQDKKAYILLAPYVRPISQKHEKDLNVFANKYNLPPLTNKYTPK